MLHPGIFQDHVLGLLLFLFYSFFFFLGELATCIALTVMTTQIACKPFFPPVLLLFPSNPVSQVGSLT